MESAASTVTTLRTPDTSTRAQWPVRTTMLSTPLIVTVLSLQAMVRFSSTPDTLMLPPGGAVETVAAELVNHRSLSEHIQVSAALVSNGLANIEAGAYALRSHSIHIDAGAAQSVVTFTDAVVAQF